jgi:predicted RNase H-like HicB family nuclease
MTLRTVPQLIQATDEARWFTTGRARAVARSRAPRTLTLDHGFRAVFKPSLSGGWVVSLPTLPHLFAQGRTLAGARAHAQALIHAHLSSLGRLGHSLRRAA